MPKTKKTFGVVVSALRARTQFGSLLQHIEKERTSLVIEKRGTPRAVLLSIQNYIRLAAPEPEVLRIIGEESKRKGTYKLSAKQIDEIIRKTRARKPKRGLFRFGCSWIRTSWLPPRSTPRACLAQSFFWQPQNPRNYIYLRQFSRSTARF